MASPTVSPTTVIAYFDNQSSAQTAVSQLQQAGFTANQIGVASRGPGNDSDYAGSEADQGTYTAQTTGSTTAAGADYPVTGTSVSKQTGAAGRTSESAWDKFKNFFSSNEVEPYPDERARGDLASHEVTTGSGYTNDDFRSSLSGLSVPEERSRYFGHRFDRSGHGAVVTVNAAEREAEAEKILTENGGDLGKNVGGYDYSQTGAEQTGVDRPGAERTPAGGRQRIQLLGEVLRVHKDRVSRGEVRIRKEVITETQTVEVPVTREELVIERTAPTGAHTATGKVGEGSEIRIPLTEEVASAGKDTVVREEVAVGKRAVQSVSNVGDSVSHEELVVDDSTKNADLNKKTA